MMRRGCGKIKTRSARRGNQAMLRYGVLLPNSNIGLRFRCVWKKLREWSEKYSIRLPAYFPGLEYIDPLVYPLTANDSRSSDITQRHGNPCTGVLPLETSATCEPSLRVNFWVISRCNSKQQNKSIQAQSATRQANEPAGIKSQSLS